MSCPTGNEMKTFIEFLRTYSEDHKNETAVDSLRHGIDEWQCLQEAQNCQRLPNERKHTRLSSARRNHILRSLSRIFGKRHTK